MSDVREFLARKNYSEILAPTAVAKQAESLTFGLFCVSLSAPKGRLTWVRSGAPHQIPRPILRRASCPNSDWHQKGSMTENKTPASSTLAEATPEDQKAAADRLRRFFQRNPGFWIDVERTAAGLSEDLNGPDYWEDSDDASEE